MSNGKQVHITLYDENLNYLIKELDMNNDIKYYVLYKNSYINPNWTFLYIQAPNTTFHYTDIISLQDRNCLKMYYRGDSDELINDLECAYSITTDELEGSYDGDEFERQ